LEALCRSTAQVLVGLLLVGSLGPAPVVGTVIMLINVFTDSYAAHHG